MPATPKTKRFGLTHERNLWKCRKLMPSLQNKYYQKWNAKTPERGMSKSWDWLLVLQWKDFEGRIWKTFGKLWWIRNSVLDLRQSLQEKRQKPTQLFAFDQKPNVWKTWNPKQRNWRVKNIGQRKRLKNSKSFWGTYNCF